MLEMRSKIVSKFLCSLYLRGNEYTERTACFSVIRHTKGHDKEGDRNCAIFYCLRVYDILYFFQRYTKQLVIATLEILLGL